MRRFIYLVALVLATACASARATEYDVPAPVAVTLPLVLVTNSNFYDAVVYLEGIRICEVVGLSGEKLVPLDPSMVVGGILHFTAKFRRSGVILELPEVHYSAGRKMHVDLKDQLSNSTAWD